MKVGDLIFRLGRYDPGLEIHICHGATNEFWEIDEDDLTDINDASVVHALKPYKRPNDALDQDVVIVVAKADKGQYEPSVFFRS